MPIRRAAAVASTLAAFAAALLAGPARAQEQVRLGQTQQQVLEMLGEPTGKMEMGDTLILMYPEGNITLGEGVVTELPRKKIYAREGGSGSGKGGARSRPSGPAWPPAYSVSPQPTANEMAAVIPEFGYLEATIAADARRRGLEHSPEAIRREALGIWAELLGSGADSVMGLYKTEAAEYRAKHSVKKDFDYKDQRETTGQVKCGASETMQYMSELPAGGSARGDCWLLGKQREFARMYTVEAYDYGHYYDKSVWIQQHWDRAAGAWDSLTAGQRAAFKAEFAGMLQTQGARLKTATDNPPQAAALPDLVQLYKNEFRRRAYEKFAPALRDLPVPP